jgi:hypothetical protein
VLIRGEKEVETEPGRWRRDRCARSLQRLDQCLYLATGAGLLSFLISILIGPYMTSSRRTGATLDGPSSWRRMRTEL